jgi:hypothetical protein
MDQIFANRLQVGFELRDCKGRYLGFAHTLTRAAVCGHFESPFLPVLQAVKGE